MRLKSWRMSLMMGIILIACSSPGSRPSQPGELLSRVRRTLLPMIMFPVFLRPGQVLMRIRSRGRLIAAWVHSGLPGSPKKS